MCGFIQHCYRCRSLRRTRHHCRLCGSIFCAPCSAARMLLPPKFQEGTPQRVCTNCAALLMPLQPFLAGMRPIAHLGLTGTRPKSSLLAPGAHTSLDGQQLQRPPDSTPSMCYQDDNVHSTAESPP